MTAELRDSCCRVVEASQAPYRALHVEASRLRPLVNSRDLNVHDVWHELIMAAVLAGVPVRDAASIIRDALNASVEVLP